MMPHYHKSTLTWLWYHIGILIPHWNCDTTLTLWYHIGIVILHWDCDTTLTLWCTTFRFWYHIGTVIPHWNYDTTLTLWYTTLTFWYYVGILIQHWHCDTKQCGDTNVLPLIFHYWIPSIEESKQQCSLTETLHGQVAVYTQYIYLIPRPCTSNIESYKFRLCISTLGRWPVKCAYGLAPTCKMLGWFNSLELSLAPLLIWKGIMNLTSVYMCQ